MSELKLIKGLDENKKVYEIFEGTDFAWAAQQGFEEAEVEQAYDGCWYLAGYAPEKPQELINQQRITELQEYLNSTDWYIARYSETGVEIPEEVKAERQKAREEISELRGV